MSTIQAGSCDRCGGPLVSNGTTTTCGGVVSKRRRKMPPICPDEQCARERFTERRAALGDESVGAA